MPPNPNCVRTGTNVINETDLQSVLGKRYTRETARHMLHGGVIDGNGIIVRVVTSAKKRPCNGRPAKITSRLCWICLIKFHESLPGCLFITPYQATQSEEDFVFSTKQQ